MQELSKEETLSNLYTLRAGLSVISQIADNAKAKQQELNRFKNVDIQNKIHYIERTLPAELNATQAKIDKEIKQYQDKIRALSRNSGKAEDRNLQTATYRSKLYARCFKRSIILTSVCALLLILASVFFSSGNIGAGVAFTVFGLLMSAILLICGLATIFSSDKQLFSLNFLTVIKMQKTYKTAQKTSIENQAKLAKELEKQKNALYSSIRQQRELIEQAEEETERKKVRANEELVALTKQIPQKQTSIISEKLKSEPLYAALKTQFSGFLDERDWCNIDLIIFNYETGRAETLKEALHLVDMERRNEKLVNAIHTANEQIVYSIHSVAKQMQETMVRCFDRLNANLQGTLQRVSQKLDEINAQIGEQTYQLAQISKASAAQLAETERLQQALIAKSNVSSDQLVADVHYLRRLGEYAEMRR